MTDATKDLIERIAAYLSLGGLFNPEMADHGVVRDLLIDCRAELERLSAPVEPVAVKALEWVKSNSGIRNVAATALGDYEIRFTRGWYSLWFNGQYLRSTDALRFAKEAAQEHFATLKATLPAPEPVAPVVTDEMVLVPRVLSIKQKVPGVSAYIRIAGECRPAALAAAWTAICAALSQEA